MAFKESTTEERQIIAEGVFMLGAWAEGKPMQIALAAAMGFATRLAARLGMTDEDFIDYGRRNLRDARKARELQGAMGSHVSTVLDGERRILLPREAGEYDPL
jgi:hypothetical protein